MSDGISLAYYGLALTLTGPKGGKLNP